MYSRYCRVLGLRLTGGSLVIALAMVVEEQMEQEEKRREYKGEERNVLR